MTRWDGPSWEGPAFKGAARTFRATKRTEAERRNAATPEIRRRRTRQLFQRAAASAAGFTAAMEQLTTATGIAAAELDQLRTALAGLAGTTTDERPAC